MLSSGTLYRTDKTVELSYLVLIVYCDDGDGDDGMKNKVQEERGPKLYYYFFGGVLFFVANKTQKKGANIN